jgi:hypothetical protein
LNYAEHFSIVKSIQIGMIDEKSDTSSEISLLRENRAGHCSQKEMGFHKEQPKKSRISDSGRLRTLVPLEGEYFLWNQ